MMIKSAPNDCAIYFRMEVEKNVVICTYLLTEFKRSLI